MNLERMVRTGWLMGVAGWVMAATPVLAAEHGGKEHAGQEHGGATAAVTAPAVQPKEHAGTAAPVEPTAPQLRARIAAYVKERSAASGTFAINDPVTRTVRQLKLIRVHQRVGKTGAYYYACTDMKDTKSGDLLDLDFDIAAQDGALEVVDARIHKVRGKPRYTYDENDRRIPVR